MIRITFNAFDLINVGYIKNVKGFKFGIVLELLK